MLSDIIIGLKSDPVQPCIAGLRYKKNHASRFEGSTDFSSEIIHKDFTQVP